MDAGAAREGIVLPGRIDTARRLLRPFAPEDAADVLAYHAEPYGRYQRRASPTTLAEATAFIDEMRGRDWSGQPTWAIALDGRAIGICTLAFEADHRIATLGYGVGEAQRGRGCAGEAVRAVLDAAFVAYPQLHRVRALTDARNTPSIRVLEKLGFRLEGVLRSDVWEKGEFVDVAVCGVLREEWPGLDG